MIELSLTRTPIYAGYRPLAGIAFPARIYLDWKVTPKPEEAGVDPEIASLLARSFEGHKVLFLGGPLIGSSAGAWQPVSEGTFGVRLSGKISRMCVTSDSGVIATLFEQPGFDWTQRGQLGVLLPLNTDVEQLSARRIANALAEEDLVKVPEATGYLRPGDDGDFAELGFGMEKALLDWMGKLEQFANEAHVSIRTGSHNESC